MIYGAIFQIFVSPRFLQTLTTVN